MILRILRLIIRAVQGQPAPARRWGTWPEFADAGPREIPPPQSADVVWVIDGDTVVVRLAGRQTRIRLASIDCPEDGQDWGDKAKFGLINMIARSSVWVEPHCHDKYGRLVATLHVHDSKKGKTVNVNERMILLGHAWVLRDFLDHLPPAKRDDLIRMENWARARKMGLWSRPSPIPPWEWRGSA